MNGTVFKRRLPSGRITWAYNMELGHDETGKRLRRFESGFDRKSEAEKAVRKALNQRDAGEIVKPDPSTFNQFMAEWLKEHAESKCSAKTVERYRQLAEYAYPHIGAVRLQDISVLMLQRVFNKLKESGGRNRKTKKSRPLSAKTVRHIAGLASPYRVSNCDRMGTTQIESGDHKESPQGRKEGSTSARCSATRLVH